MLFILWQRHARVQASNEGPKGLYLFDHDLLAIVGTELRQLLPNVSVLSMKMRYRVNLSDISLTATLGFSTTVSLLLAA